MCERVERFLHNMSSRELPQEILRDILERLPVKIIIICTSVCKSWHSLITDSYFIISHLNKAKLSSTGCLLRMPLSKSEEQTSRVICENTMIERFNMEFPFNFNVNPVGSCNGLLCLTDRDNEDYGRIVYLWNPSIRKFKSLPRPPNVTPQLFNPRTRVVLGLGFDQVSDDHKIVRLMYFWDNERNGFGQKPNEIEVYSLKKNSWRSIEANVSCKAEKGSTALVNGSAHWIARRQEGPDWNLILSFDFSNEVFQEMMLPATCYKDIEINSEVLAGFHGSLSMLINCSPDDAGMIYFCYMWVMKEYGVAESWVLQFKFLAREGIYKLPGLTTEGDIIYQNKKMEYIVYDPMDGKHKNTGLHGFRFHMIAYRESLVLLDEH